MGGYFLEYNNFIPADPLKTPLHIAPVWYFTPYYSMLRAITSEMMYVLIACVLRRRGARRAQGASSARCSRSAIAGRRAWWLVALLLAIDAKFWGVVVMGGAVIILFFLPWLDHSPVKSIRYRPTGTSALYGVFVVNFLVLGYLGMQPPSPIGERVSQVGTLFYFGFFLLMPWWSRLGEFKPVPDRVTFRPLTRSRSTTHMKKHPHLACSLALGFVPAACWPPAAASRWDKFPDENATDLAALQNGAKLFVNYCLNCHSAAYMRYNRLRDIGLTEEQIKNNLMFATDKVGDT